MIGWWEKGAFEPGIGVEDGRKRTAGAPTEEKTRPEFSEEEGRAIGLSSPSGVLVPGQRLLTAAGLAGARGPGRGPAQRGGRPLLTGKGQQRNLVRGGAGGEDGDREPREYASHLGLFADDVVRTKQVAEKEVELLLFLLRCHRHGCRRERGQPGGEEEEEGDARPRTDHRKAEPPPLLSSWEPLPSLLARQTPPAGAGMPRAHWLRSGGHVLGLGGESRGFMIGRGRPIVRSLPFLFWLLRRFFSLGAASAGGDVGIGRE